MYIDNLLVRCTVSSGSGIHSFSRRIRHCDVLSYSVVDSCIFSSRPVNGLGSSLRISSTILACLSEESTERFW